MVAYKEAPGYSRNKAKGLAGMISSTEKKMNRCSFDVVIEKKMLDEKPVVVCRMNNYYNYPQPIGNSSPLSEEYTDVEKFAKAVHDKIVAAGKEL